MNSVATMGSADALAGRRVVGLRAMPDQVIVRPVNLRPTQTASGVVRVVADVPCTAQVVEIGPEAAARCGIGVGAVITYSKFAGTEVEAGEERLLILAAVDVLAELVTE